MWLLVGLGNPGSRYARTRHNAGFMVLDAMASDFDLTFQEKSTYRIASGSMGGEKVIFLEPLTFMNLSGRAVRPVASRNAIPPERIIVVQDDLDMEVGRLKIRTTGSSGGHKGVASIMQELGSRDFIRVKIGIGRDPVIPTEAFVLSKFRKEEISLLKDALKRAAEAAGVIISEGPGRAMNKYN